MPGSELSLTQVDGACIGVIIESTVVVLSPEVIPMALCMLHFVG